MSKSTGEFEVVGNTIVPVIVNDVVTGTEASECADMYLDTLRMERCEGEVPVYSIQRQLIDKPKREALHVTADIVISLPDCDGMTDEFLFLQPSHGEYLEELTEEHM